MWVFCGHARRWCPPRDIENVARIVIEAVRSPSDVTIGPNEYKPASVETGNMWVVNADDVERHTARPRGVSQAVGARRVGVKIQKDVGVPE